MLESVGATDNDNPDDKPPPRTDCSAAVVAGEADSPEGPQRDPDNDWNNWRWQMRNRIRSFADLGHLFPRFTTSRGMAEAAETFPLAITPYYASLIRSLDRTDPIFQMSVPQADELVTPGCLMDDPLGEDGDMPVPGLVHRYRDRALLLATTTCSTYCRHCTRKRVAGQTETTISSIRLSQATEYLSVHPEIKDVVVSGGDPFTMSTSSLEKVLRAVRSVPTVDIIRVGTRTPVVLPMRITRDLAQMLRQFHPLYVNTHFNHPAEVTPQAEEACARLADVGIPLGNQSVLLRGVNDSPQTLEALFRRMVRMRVRPYYLFQCDLVRGVEHFRTPISRGIEIMEYLRGRLSGLAIPTYVVDAPHGGGKIPVLPNYVVSMSPSNTVLRNYEGELVAYPEPTDVSGFGSSAGEPTAVKGVWGLLSGQQTRIDPKPNRARVVRPRCLRPAVAQLELKPITDALPQSVAR